MPPAPNVFPDGTDMGWVDQTDFEIAYTKSEPNWDPPFYGAGLHWLYWNGVRIDRGEVKDLALLPGATSLENEKGHITVHPGGKGKGKPSELKLKEKPTVIEFKDVAYLDGSKGKVWHFMMKVPSNFKIMGQGFKFSGTAEQIRVKGASFAKGTVRGELIEIHDTNANGAFNDFGMDTVLIGKGKEQKVLPLSKFIELNGGLYELKVEANGTTVRTKPYDGPLAAVKFEYKSNKMPISFLMAGSGADSIYFVNMMDAVEKPIWVVPTMFRVAHGYIAEGSGDKRISITIGPGRSSPTDVQAGKLETLTFGGGGTGFTLNCAPEDKKNDKGEPILFIPGTSVLVYGSGGEEYSNMTFGAVVPDVHIRKGKEGKAFLREEMKTRDRSQYDATTIVFPADFELDKTWKGDYQIKLIADYAPLGKMESDWLSGN
jgi:hypothetical protein